jgi:hypothetical protein
VYLGLLKGSHLPCKTLVVDIAGESGEFNRRATATAQILAGISLRVTPLWTE